MERSGKGPDYDAVDAFAQLAARSGGNRESDRRCQHLAHTLTASAADPNLPPQTINYVLGPGAPSGAAITTNGVFTWTPTAAQAPNTYSISVIAIDSSVPPLSATNSFSVVVYSPNTPPVLIGIANRSIFADTRLTFIASATDTDQPPQTISYALGPGAPFGAEITTNGIFSWTPTADQAPSTNSITVVATDNGMPPLSATNSFLVADNPWPARRALLTWTIPMRTTGSRWTGPTTGFRACSGWRCGS